MHTITQLFKALCNNPDDAQTWDSVVKRYGEWLLPWVFQRTRNRDFSEDVVQDVFLCFYQRRWQWTARINGSPRPWIAKVTVNTIRERLRRNRRFAALAGEQLAALLNNEQAAVDDLDMYLEIAEQCEQYVAAWATLATDSKVAPPTILAFLLRVRDQCTPAEAACRLGLTATAVNTHVARVREYFGTKIGLSKERWRQVDYLDGIARQSAEQARILEECARHYGYPPEPGNIA